MKLIKRSIIVLCCLFFSSILSGQEKRNYLMHRYDGYTKVITKDFSKKQLIDLKNDLARQGINFSYTFLIYNKNKEIVKINIQLKNSKSKSNVVLYNKNLPIPKTEIGEINGIVVIVPNSEKSDSSDDFNNYTP